MVASAPGGNRISLAMTPARIAVATARDPDDDFGDLHRDRARAQARARARFHSAENRPGSAPDTARARASCARLGSGGRHRRACRRRCPSTSGRDRIDERRAAGRCMSPKTSASRSIERARVARGRDQERHRREKQQRAREQGRQPGGEKIADQVRSTWPAA